ncbi:hypothetical protein MSAN_00995000 [Mycena sanguinolenta]|uniref:Sfi1 spindle body domain-containing protein n=1 Tax=Mycena sanguinolenta TaxID=230812 RepID=A0A8H6YLJ8_9AGAR|nr:hypothetical protein MSAN_00995000 [Mycena sanguinolenta]
MPDFKPTRTSPPLTTFTESLLTSTLSADLSRSSSVSIKELTGLTHEDVELLDAIIARAGATATTFPAVFAAYNAILKERGLDPSEVVFYGKLLKLGTLKGTNWGEKWRMVKTQQGYGDVPRASRLPALAPKPRKDPPPRLTRRDSKISRRVDSPTLHSYGNESTNIGSDEDPVSVDVPQYHLLKRPAAMRSVSPSRSEFTLASLDSRKLPLPAPNIRSRPMPPAGGQMRETDASDKPSAPACSSTSYPVAARDRAPSRRRIITPTSPSPTNRPTPTSLATARQLVAQARERKGSVVNEDDAWNKIKMLQDEKDADAFRKDWLIERCWEVWKEVFQWRIVCALFDSGTRIKVYTDRQHTKSSAKLEIFSFFGKVSIAGEFVPLNPKNASIELPIRKTPYVFKLLSEHGEKKTKEKKLARWRASLRSRMKTVRDKRELKLVTEAMTKWRQVYQTHSSDRHYARSLVLRYYGLWRKRLAHVDQLDDAADGLSRGIEGRILENFWYRWRHASQVQLAYRVVADNVGLRVKTEAMEKRAAAQAGLQDRRFLHAMYMIMRACYQKRRLEAIADSGRLREAWAVWKTRLQQQKKLEDAALAFSIRLKSPLAKTVFQKWRKAQSIQQNLQTVAAFHHSKSLLRRMWLRWRIALLNHRKVMSKAQAVDDFLTIRSTWTVLRARFAERRREYTLQALELRKTRNIFYAWLDLTHRRRAQRLAEKQIQARIIKRILSTALTRWTNRTIEVKNRELETTMKRDIWLMKTAFKRWKSAHKHHTSVVSLMESYQLVKREDLLKKIFHRWLSAGRKARHRRLTLDRKESEIKFGQLSVAWDKWRDRFKQQRLQPVEYDVILQSHKRTLTRAFRLWQSKTKSLPAIRFDALRLKRIQAKYWNIWRKALPQALQAKTAREFEKKVVQCEWF